MADIDDLDLADLDDLDEEEEEKASPKKKARAKAKKPTGIGAAAVAEKLGTDGKTFRAWLRRKMESGAIKPNGHEPKARYSWATWQDPHLVTIMKAWKEDDHTRGGKRKGKGKAKAKTTKAKSKPKAKAKAKR